MLVLTSIGLIGAATRRRAGRWTRRRPRRCCPGVARRAIRAATTATFEFREGERKDVAVGEYIGPGCRIARSSSACNTAAASGIIQAA